MNYLYNYVQSPWPQWGGWTVYQPLLYINETLSYKYGGIQFLPGLAQNWTVSADSKTYVFNLRQGVTFSDGNPLNAYQAWMNFYIQYYISGNFSAFWYGFNIFNMSAVQFGPATMAALNQTGLTNPSAAMVSVMENSSWPIYVSGPYQIR